MGIIKHDLAEAVSAYFVEHALQQFEQNVGLIVMVPGKQRAS
jgi:hypothetical protein